MLPTSPPFPPPLPRLRLCVGSTATSLNQRVRVKWLRGIEREVHIRKNSARLLHFDLLVLVEPGCPQLHDPEI